MIRPTLSRRRWFKQSAALASAAALSPWLPAVRAQTATALNALPRVALVIGNTRYADSPLKNPGNDAKAIADALRGTGFQVDLKLDAGRIEMLDAINAFGAQLAKNKGVGAFYYAGHGAQLAWKNYLVPVDAQVDRLEDMQSRTVELNALLEGLARARNAMNVVILDACRDNPFGNKVMSQQKGLSQFDAPAGSLLAYATSPGNTAADGDGANGLYTENLLRELRVPDAKIEDVFKRVRLNVRRRSEGHQIPWESTSLEDDFYFLPPAQIRKLSEAELEKSFSEELAVWEKIRDSKDPAPYIGYLEKYPSGKFSELAQFQLDRALKAAGEKKVEPVAAVENPYTKGSARIDTQFRVGDTYTYRRTDRLTQLNREMTTAVTGITDAEVVYNNGDSTTDLLGNRVRLRDGRRFTNAQEFIPEYSVGKKWASGFLVTGPNIPGGQDYTDLEFKVVARERTTVPAGTFDAFHVRVDGWTRGGLRIKSAYWIAPEVRKPIAMELDRRHRGGRILDYDRVELVSYKQG